MAGGLNLDYMHTDDWVRVAGVYADAVNQGLSPVLALQNELDRSAETVEKLIEMARANGYIQDAQTPKGTWSAELVAVARALGVTYERLTEAIRVHAHGVLRV
jgi:CTP-dependent riboflavin kinase